MNLDPHRRTLALKLGSLVVAAALAVGLNAGEAESRSGSLYRYERVDSGEDVACGFDYIDLADAGRPLVLAPADAGTPPDDAAAVLPLQAPFELYQSSTRALVVSGNGYLAAAGSLGDDDGSDFSNDCPLPLPPDNGQARGNRIYVYHDDLRLQAGGQVRQAWFPHCPRAGAAGDEACTVVEWQGFEVNGPLRSTQPLKAQAVLYHRSHQVALQYASLDDSRGATATIGLQGFDARAGAQHSCNGERPIAPRQAVCFFDPRARPSAALRGRPAKG